MDIHKKALSLHSQLSNNGYVAQLYRASDYGSEGYRLESYRGHEENKDHFERNGLFFLYTAAELVPADGLKRKGNLAIAK